MLGRLLGAFVFTVVISLHPVSVQADEKFARWDTNWGCMDKAAYHIVLSGGDKWNGLTANNCVADHTMRTKVVVQESNGFIDGECDTGSLTDFAKCQAVADYGPGGGSVHYHWYDGQQASFGVWQSTD